MHIFANCAVVVKAPWTVRIGVSETLISDFKRSNSLVSCQDPVLTDSSFHETTNSPLVQQQSNRLVQYLISWSLNDLLTFGAGSNNSTV